MSGYPMDAKLDNIPQDDGPPRHQVHNSNEPLPGSHADQQPAEVKHRSDRAQEEAGLRAQGYNAFNSDSERPLESGIIHRPTRAVVAARAGEDDLPKGKANILDKTIGKMQKIIGKATHNADMHEAGELREAGGEEGSHR